MKPGKHEGMFCLTSWNGIRLRLHFSCFTTKTKLGFLSLMKGRFDALPMRRGGRIQAGFRALYSNDDIKKYSGADTMFSTLPPEVNKVLLHEFTDMLDSDFKIILENDPLQIPEGIQLFDTVEENINEIDTSDIFLPSSLLQGEGLSPTTENKVGTPGNFVDTPANFIVDDSALPPTLDTDNILENSVSDNAKKKRNVENMENENISSEEEEENEEENMVLRSGKRVRFS